MKKILVVDDEKDIVEIISMYLEREDYKVMGACDGVEALQKIISSPPDLVILDIMMPEIDGHSLNIKLKENPETKDIKVVIVSVSGSNKKMELAEKFNVSDYFVKSNYRIDELVGLVTKIVNGHSDGKPEE